MSLILGTIYNVGINNCDKNVVLYSNTYLSHRNPVTCTHFISHLVYSNIVYSNISMPYFSTKIKMLYKNQ